MAYEAIENEIALDTIILYVYDRLDQYVETPEIYWDLIKRLRVMEDIKTAKW